MPKAAPKAGGGGGAKTKAYSRPEAFSSNEILTDTGNKKWKLGKSIGSGGFGDIYLASDDTSKPVVDKTAQYVVKIEPHANGPLFVEIAFYLRAAKLEMINEWKAKSGKAELGMPPFVASGLHEYKGQKYRFMVIPRFGQDLHKIIQAKPTKRLTSRSIQAISLQIIDILEYIHSKDFVHADIKASNLLLGLGKKPQLFLLDYGLAVKFVGPTGEHLKYAPDARKAHNGTLEYTSRDAHIGAFSRRGDLEILGYNMLEWLCGKLPWSPNEAPDIVHRQKNSFMAKIELRKLYPPDTVGLDIVEKFLKYVSGLEFEEVPNYAACREILKKGLPPKVPSLYLDDALLLPPPPPPPSSSFSLPNGKKKGGGKRGVAEGESGLVGADGVDGEPVSPKKIKLPDEETKAKRATRTTKKVRKNFNWARVLSSNPERIIHLASAHSNNSSATSSTSSPNSSILDGTAPLPPNLTPAMLQILSKRKENVEGTTGLSRGSSSAKSEIEGTTMLTPAMKEILLKTKKKKLRKSLTTLGGGLVVPAPTVKKTKGKISAPKSRPAPTAPIAAASKKPLSDEEDDEEEDEDGEFEDDDIFMLPAPPKVVPISSREARHIRRNT